MVNRWKKISELDCVKELGLGHKIAHLLGIHMISRCFIVFDKKYGD